MISLCVMVFHNDVFADDICLDAGYGIYNGVCQSCPQNTEVKTESLSIPCAADLEGTVCQNQCFDAENLLLDTEYCIINDNQICEDCLAGYTSNGGEDTCKCNASGYCFDGETCRGILGNEYITADSLSSSSFISVCNACSDGFKPNYALDGCEQFCSDANQGYENGQCITCADNNMIVSTSETGVRICKSCSGNKSYKDGACVLNCGNGYQSVNNVCVSCQDLGKVWNGSQCVDGCSTGYTPVNGVCLCNDSGYGMENNICQKCSLFYKVPFSGNGGNNVCNTCESRGDDFKYFQDGQCVACIGDNDYHYENSDEIELCVTCDDYQEFDTNTKTCNSCKANEYYDDKKCKSCPVNHTCDAITKEQCEFGTVTTKNNSECVSSTKDGEGYLYNGNIVDWGSYRTGDDIENYGYGQCPSGSVSKTKQLASGGNYHVCGSCDTGETSNESNTKCLCTVNSYGLIGGNCVKCPNGVESEKDSEGNNICKSCGAGTGFDGVKCDKCKDGKAAYDGLCMTWNEIPGKNANGQIGMYQKGDSTKGYTWEKCAPGTCCLNGQSYSCLSGTFTDFGGNGTGNICENEINGKCKHECNNGRTTDGTGKYGSESYVCTKDILATEFCIGGSSLCFTFEGNKYVNAPTRFYSVEYITNKN